MAFDFPTSPAVNDTYTSGSVTYRWNGSAWVLVSLAHAPIDSPTFTGDPKAPTPATADNDTSIATTAFVKAQGYAPLASPALTGTPTVPTAPVDDNSTKAANTNYVIGQLASTNPVVNGTAAPGTSSRISRADHVHPIDTSRVAKGGDTMTGPLNFVGASHWGYASPGAGSYYATSVTVDRFFVGTDVSGDTWRIYAAGAAINAVMVDGASGVTTFAVNPTISPASGGAALNLDPQAASQQALTNFKQSGVTKWQHGKASDNSFFLYNNTLAGYAFTIDPATNLIIVAGDPSHVQGIVTKQYADFYVTSLTNTKLNKAGVQDGSNAAGGVIGEYLEAEVAAGSPVSLTSGSVINVVSLSLTAGDWDVWGWMGTSPAGGTTTAFCIGFISDVSATFGGGPNKGAYVNPVLATTGAGVSLSFPVGQRRFNFTSTTTIYLEIYASFSGGTNAGFGGIYARRRR